MVINIHRRAAACLFACLCLGLLPLHAKAAGLTGTSVTGTLKFGAGTTNLFDPANGSVPAGYLNTAGPTVTIAAPAVEFGFADFGNTDLVNFSATQFTIEDVVTNTGNNALFTMTFTDAAFAGISFSKVSDSFPYGGLTYTLVGNQFTVVWAGGPVNLNDDFTSTFVVTAVPEPSTWMAFAVGAGALGLALRRKQVA